MSALELHAGLLPHALVKVNLYARIFQHDAKDLFIHMRFGKPVGRTVQIEYAIVSRSLHIEVARIPANDGVVSQVRSREPAGDHAS